MRNLIKNLIDYILFYAFSKIYNQYTIIKLIDKYSKKFKEYAKIFIIIMDFLCLYKIKKKLKIEKKSCCLKMYIFIDDLKS